MNAKCLMVVSDSDCEAEEEEEEAPEMDSIPPTQVDAEMEEIMKKKTLLLGEEDEEAPGFQMPDSQPKKPGDPLWSPAPTETASSPASSCSRPTAVKGPPPAKVCSQAAMEEKEKNFAKMQEEFLALQAEMYRMRKEMAVVTPAKQKAVFSPPPPPASFTAPVAPGPAIAPPPPAPAATPKAAAKAEATPKAVPPKAAAVAPVSAEEARLAEDYDLSAEVGFSKVKMLIFFSAQLRSCPAGVEPSCPLYEVEAHVPTHSGRTVASEPRGSQPVANW